MFIECSYIYRNPKTLETLTTFLIKVGNFYLPF